MALEIETGTALYHGGCPGLESGDLILPAVQVGTESVSGAHGAPYRSDRVYLTSDVLIARSYAGVYASPKALRDQIEGRTPSFRELSFGDVYEVEPLGPLEPDLDYEFPDLSFQASHARVLTVIERSVPPEDLEPELAALITAAHTRTQPSSQRPIGRNDLCACGSNLKYKKCCGR